MAKSDWLSFDEITRLWSEETGLEASAFQEDLEKWFAAFIKQPQAPPAAASANRMLGLLGAHILERTTFEVFCKVSNYPKPRFWFVGKIEESWGDNPKQLEPEPSLPYIPSPQCSDALTNETDLELATIQTQVVSLSDSRHTSKTDSSGFSDRAVVGQPSAESSFEQAGTQKNQVQNKLAMRAATIRPELRDLKVQFEAAEQHIVDPRAKGEANRISTLAKPSVPPPQRDITKHRSSTGTDFEHRIFVNSKNPQFSNEMHPLTYQRRSKFGLVNIMIVLASLLIALLLWSAATVIQVVNSAQNPSTVEMADRMAGLRALAGGEHAARRKGRYGTIADTGPGRGDKEVAALGRQADIAIRSATDVNNTLAIASAVIAKLRKENARLRDELTKAQSNESHVRLALQEARSALQEAEDEIKVRREALAMASTVSSARVVALQSELKRAHQKISSLSEAIGSAEEVAARLREWKSPDRTPRSDDNAVEPSTKILRTTTQSSVDYIGSATGGMNVIVALNDLLLEPGNYFGRVVVVTGFVARIAGHYWIQSEIGRSSMLIDVEMLQSHDGKELKEAFEQVGFLSQLRARVKGKIERQGTAKYYLSASELVLIE